MVRGSSHSGAFPHAHAGLAASGAGHGSRRHSRTRSTVEDGLVGPEASWASSDLPEDAYGLHRSLPASPRPVTQDLIHTPAPQGFLVQVGLEAVAEDSQQASEGDTAGTHVSDFAFASVQKQRRQAREGDAEDDESNRGMQPNALFERQPSLDLLAGFNLGAEDGPEGFGSTTKSGGFTWDALFASTAPSLQPTPANKAFGGTMGRVGARATEVARSSDAPFGQPLRHQRATQETLEDAAAELIKNVSDTLDAVLHGSPLPQEKSPRAPVGSAARGAAAGTQHARSPGTARATPTRATAAARQPVPELQQPMSNGKAQVASQSVRQTHSASPTVSRISAAQSKQLTPSFASKYLEDSEEEGSEVEQQVGAPDDTPEPSYLGTMRSNASLDEELSDLSFPSVGAGRGRDSESEEEEEAVERSAGHLDFGRAPASTEDQGTQNHIEDPPGPTQGTGTVGSLGGVFESLGRESTAVHPGGGAASTGGPSQLPGGTPSSYGPSYMGPGYSGNTGTSSVIQGGRQQRARARRLSDTQEASVSNTPEGDESQLDEDALSMGRGVVVGGGGGAGGKARVPATSRIATAAVARAMARLAKLSRDNQELEEAALQLEAHLVSHVHCAWAFASGRAGSVCSFPPV